MVKYTYEELYQLTHEDNVYLASTDYPLGKTITYANDAGGNILIKREYALILRTFGRVVRTFNYNYGNPQ